MSVRNILFHVGGPAFHPVAEQATQISAWLGDGFRCRLVEGNAAFEALDEADLFVPMGLFWTGMKDAYTPPSETQRAAFEAYVASGRPLLSHHGAIASYDDWPRFGALLGFTWVWGQTAHSPVQAHHVEINGAHPVVEGVTGFEIVDELYYDVKLTPGLVPAAHATADWKDRTHPMILTAEGGRADLVADAGKTAYLANGHDLRAFEAPAMRQIWRNTVAWLLD